MELTLVRLQLGVVWMLLILKELLARLLAVFSSEHSIGLGLFIVEVCHMYKCFLYLYYSGCHQSKQSL